MVGAFYPGLKPRVPLAHARNGTGVGMAIGRTSEGERDQALEVKVQLSLN